MESRSGLADGLHRPAVRHRTWGHSRLACRRLQVRLSLDSPPFEKGLGKSSTSLAIWSSGRLHTMRRGSRARPIGRALLFLFSCIFGCRPLARKQRLTAFPRNRRGGRTLHVLLAQNLCHERDRRRHTIPRFLSSSTWSHGPGHQRFDLARDCTPAGGIGICYLFWAFAISTSGFT